MGEVNSVFIVIGVIALAGGLLLLNYSLGLFRKPFDNANNPDPQERKATGNDYVRTAIMVGSGMAGFLLAIFGLYMTVDGIREGYAKKK